jgi:hypothetical protein
LQTGGSTVLAGPRVALFNATGVSLTSVNSCVWWITFSLTFAFALPTALLKRRIDFTEAENATRSTLKVALELSERARLSSALTVFGAAASVRKAVAADRLSLTFALALALSFPFGGSRTSLQGWDRENDEERE